MKITLISIMLSSISAFAATTAEETDAALQNMSKVLTEARMVPHVENGEFIENRPQDAIPADGTMKELTIKQGEVLTAPDTEYQ